MPEEHTGAVKENYRWKVTALAPARDTPTLPHTTPHYPTLPHNALPCFPDIAHQEPVARGSVLGGDDIRVRQRHLPGGLGTHSGCTVICV